MSGEEEAYVEEAHVEVEAPEEEEEFEDNGEEEEEEGAPQGGGHQQQVNYILVEF
jgi:hypothetical protein